MGCPELGSSDVEYSENIEGVVPLTALEFVSIEPLERIFCSMLLESSTPRNAGAGTPLEIVFGFGRRPDEESRPVGKGLAYMIEIIPRNIRNE